MWRELPNNIKALFFAATILVISVCFSWVISGWVLATFIGSVLLILFWIARSTWISDKSNFKLRASAVTITSFAILAPSSWWIEFVLSITKQYGWAVNITPPNQTSSIILAVLALTLLFIVFYFTQNQPVDKPHKSISKLIEGPTIIKKWESICLSLANQIRDIDSSTNWSHEYYTPLDAEVEIKTSRGKKKVVTDLLEAIKFSTDRLFLLIGDPGAGKSVAMRKLCLDILKTSVKDEYIPIYINLKEWTSTKDWSVEPPTWRDLEAFVKQSLMNKDRYLGDFFEQYYNVLDENGNLFFILDSFDEIPQILGTSANSLLIEDITKVCREFLQGAKQFRSKGILASREYRMPREENLQAKTTLRVQPFTLSKIQQTLTQNSKISDDAVKNLLKSRPELIPNLRNPFIASLLRSFLEENQNQHPVSQANLYESYIKSSVNKAISRLGKTKLTYDEVKDCAIKIAVLISNETGLEVPVGKIKSAVVHPKIDEVIEILRYTRIARGDRSSDISQFSFTHRRFYEYFIVQNLINQQANTLPLNNIPTDSKWRDTLVLYCEVASFENAKTVANYCWFDIISRENDISLFSSKHALRFLSEAFRGRQECLEDFQTVLSEYILEVIQTAKDPINIKIAVEALGILDDESLTEGTIMAINLNDSWIIETAVKGCRHLGAISHELKMAISSIFLPHIVYFGDDFFPQLKFDLEKGKLREIKNSFLLSEQFKVFSNLIEIHIEKKLLARICFLSSIIFGTIFNFKNNLITFENPVIALISVITSVVVPLFFYFMHIAIFGLLLKVSWFKRYPLVFSLDIIDPKITSFWSTQKLFGFISVFIIIIYLITNAIIISPIQKKVIDLSCIFSMLIFAFYFHLHITLIVKKKLGVSFIKAIFIFPCNYSGVKKT